jgi:hypothetical protein
MQEGGTPKAHGLAIQQHSNSHCHPPSETANRTPSGTLLRQWIRFPRGVRKRGRAGTDIRAVFLLPKRRCLLGISLAWCIPVVAWSRVSGAGRPGGPGGPRMPGEQLQSVGRGGGTPAERRRQGAGPGAAPPRDRQGESARACAAAARGATHQAARSEQGRRPARRSRRVPCLHPSLPPYRGLGAEVTGANREAPCSVSRGGGAAVCGAWGCSLPGVAQRVTRRRAPLVRRGLERLCCRSARPWAQRPTQDRRWLGGLPAPGCVLRYRWPPAG